jgi:TonB-dependent receptor
LRPLLAAAIEASQCSLIAASVIPLREFSAAAGVLFGALLAGFLVRPGSALAQASEPARGELQVVVVGDAQAPLEAVSIELAGARQDTNPQGTAYLQAPEGVHKVRLVVPHVRVPEAPVQGDEPWLIDLGEVPVVVAQTTLVRVTLSRAGAVAGLDVKAPELAGGDRSMNQEFEQALQSGAVGTLTGSVIARADESTVADARIYVRGAPVEAKTDGNGNFTLKLPAGKYLIAAIHPDFGTQSLPDVIVRGNDERSVRFELSPRSVDLDEFTVKAAHIEGGIASTIAERRETTAVADVIGAEQMARSGDTSAASALSRVTGLTVVDGRFVIVRGLGERYSSMTLNRLQVPSPEPTRRVVPLDLFPAGVLESVLVQKTYSPDLPGEFGGGLVQVRSREYPEKFLLNLTLTSQLNSQTHLRNQMTYEGGGRDWLGFDDGTRELPREIRNAPKLSLGNIFSDTGYTEDQLSRLGGSLPNRYSRSKKFVPPDIGFVASVGNRWQLRHAKIGFVAALGYKNQYNAVRNATTRTVQLEQGRTVIADDFRLSTAEQQISTSAFLDWGVEFSRDHKLKFTTMLLRQSEDTTTLRTGFDIDLTRDTSLTRLSWVERQVFLQQVGGSHTFDRLRDFHVDWRYSYASASRYEPDRRDYQYSTGNGVDYLIDTGASNQRLWGDMNDQTNEGQLDFVQPFSVWQQMKAKLKFGAYGYRRSREAWVRRFEFNIAGLPADVARLAPEQIFTPMNIGSTVRFREVSLANDTYDASLDLQAGYVTMELPIYKRLDLMAGARLEHALIKVSTFDQFAPDAPPEVARLNNLDALPAATGTWRFIDDFQLRAGYSRTLNRPDLRELSSGQFNDVEANARLIGSPNLKRALIDSYDLRLEWYYSSDEVFSVGAFFKQFKDPIEATVQPGQELVYSFVNTDKASIRGLEFDARKRFSFIHESLEALYVAGNVSWIDSEVEIRTFRGDLYRRPLQSQSPWVVNVQLGWDNSAPGGTGTAVALLYNVSGRRIRAVGDPNFQTPDQYENPFHRLDLVFSQALPHGLRLGIKGQNLLNSEQTWRQGDVVVRRFRRGVDVAASLAWSY